MSSALWQVEGLSFRHPGRWLFDGLSLQLSPGLHWLQGANGSGKSTLLRLLAGVLPPLSGRLRLSGLDPVADALAYRQALFWCGPDGIALAHLRGHEYLGLLAGLFPHWQAERLPALLDALGLSPQLQQPVGRLSTGSQRKLQLAAAAVAGTAGVLLDEPLNALDSAARAVLDALLSEALQGPRIWLVASHEALPQGARVIRL